MSRLVEPAGPAGRLARRARRVLPSGLTSLAGIACALCCLIPVLAAAGILTGTGWAIADAWLPGVAVVLAALAGLAWWWSRRRRHANGCSGGPSCACGR
ncbi:MAG: hypothetical protein J2P15_05425 [Micromonosporaceae bacterium]|nr:hypothetical protein [Micromonosporaceae bacterium]